MPFGQDIAGGNGELVVPSLKSPNFIHGIQGWSIGKDGSAEFHDIIIPAGSGGATVTFASTPPPSPNPGDLWYDTAHGLAVSQWTGSAWAPYSIGTGAIAAQAITPALNATGDTVNPNPYFSGGDLTGWITTAGVAGLVGKPTSGIAYPWAAEITVSAGASFPGILGQFFAANPGDPVQVNGWFQANCNVQFGIQYYDNSFNFLGEDITHITAGSWQYSQIAGTVAGGATQAILFVGVDSGSALGTEVIDCTALTVLTKIQGGLIEAGTVTAAQILAGTVLAGAVDGTTITGGTITGSIFQGTNWLENSSGQFMYSGTPALGNLLLSIAPVAGADAHGNAYQAGFWVYSGSQAIGLFNVGSSPSVIFSPGATHVTTEPSIFSFITNTGLVNELQWLVMSSGKESGNADAAIQLISQSADGTLAAAAIIEFGGATWGTIQAATGLIVDSWHNITLDAGWTSVVTPQYRMKPDGDVELRGQASHAGITTATNINNSNPLPAGPSPFNYRPGATRIYRPPTQGDAAATVAMGTGGVLQARASGFTATQVILDGSYSI